MRAVVPADLRLARLGGLAAGQAAQARHEEISGHNRTHYCGAYWGWGFHEDGVASGERVARQLGAAGL